MKRIAVFALATACLHAAHASYELLLVSDSATRSVHRFDAVTGAYFGSFGNGYLTGAMDVAVNKNNGLAYVRENPNTIRVFNYSTGLPGPKLGIPGQDVDVAGDGSLVVWESTGSIAHFTASGSFIERWTAPSGTTYNGVAALDDNYVSTFAYTGAVQNTLTFKFGQSAVFENLASSGYGTTARTVGGAKGHAGIITNDAAGGPLTDWLHTNGNGNFQTFGYTYVNTVMKTITGNAVGHDAWGYACGTWASDSTKGIIVRTDSYALSGTVYSSFGNGVLVSPTGMASVIAPEPSSLVAFGVVGLVAAARLRRYRAQC